MTTRMKVDNIATFEVRKAIGFKDSYLTLGVGGALSRHAITASILGALGMIFLIPSLIQIVLLKDGGPQFGANVLIIGTFVLLILPVILRMKILKPEIVYRRMDEVRSMFPSLDLHVGLFGVQAIVPAQLLDPNITGYPTEIPKTVQAIHDMHVETARIYEAQQAQAFQMSQEQQTGQASNVDPVIPPVPPMPQSPQQG